MFYQQISMNKVTEHLVKMVYGSVHVDYFPQYDILRVIITKDYHVYCKNIDGFGDKLHKGISSKSIANLIFQEYKQCLIKETMAHFIK